VFNIKNKKVADKDDIPCNLHQGKDILKFTWESIDKETFREWIMFEDEVRFNLCHNNSDNKS